MGREKTNLTLHPKVKHEAKTLAEMDGRSLSELVERLLEDFVRGHRHASQSEMQKGKAEVENGKEKMRRSKK